MSSQRPTKIGRPAQPAAVYRLVANELRKRIAAGEWLATSALPPLRTLAREYKVSLDTARAAMNVMRLENRVGLSGFRRLAVTPLLAREPVMEPVRAVLLVITEPLIIRPDSFDHQQLLLGMLQGTGELNAPLIISHSFTQRTAPPFSFLQLSPRGILIYGVLEPEGYEQYSKLPLPVVMVDRPAGRRPLHAATVDNESAARQAVGRLVALGHRKIAYLRRISIAERDVDPDSRERQAGYKKELEKAGLRYNPAIVFSVFTQDTADAPGIRALFDSRPQITAAVCADPSIARLVLEGAERRKRAVPRDLSVVCFQGTSSTINVSGPVIDFFELGRRAARMIDTPRRPPQRVRVTAGWRECGSIGPAPKS